MHHVMYGSLSTNGVPEHNQIYDCSVHAELKRVQVEAKEDWHRKNSLRGGEEVKTGAGRTNGFNKSKPVDVTEDEEGDEGESSAWRGQQGGQRIHCPCGLVNILMKEPHSDTASDSLSHTMINSDHPVSHKPNVTSFFHCDAQPWSPVNSLLSISFTMTVSGITNI